MYRYEGNEISEGARRCLLHLSMHYRYSTLRDDARKLPLLIEAKPLAEMFAERGYELPDGVSFTCLGEPVLLALARESKSDNFIPIDGAPISVEDEICYVNAATCGKEFVIHAPDWVQRLMYRMAFAGGGSADWGGWSFDSF